MAEFLLTPGPDSLTGTAGGDVFAGTADSFNPGDALSGGGGADQLDLRGSGTFNLPGLSLTGIQTIHTDGQNATIYLPDQFEGKLTWATPAANLVIHDGIDGTVYLPQGGGGSLTFIAGEGNNEVGLESSGNFKGDSLDGGVGSNSLRIQRNEGSFTESDHTLFDLTQFASLANFQLYQLPHETTNTLTGNTALLNGRTIVGGQYTDTLTSTGALDLHDATLISVERITTTSSAGVILAGNSGAHAMTGGAGHDTLVGNGGADTLTGLAGNDMFQGTAAQLNGVTITDFVQDDRIDMTDLASPGATLSLTGDVLQVYSAGKQVAAITLSGVAVASFALTDNGAGGTWISRTESTPSTPALATASDTGTSSTDGVTRAAALDMSGFAGAQTGTATVFIDSNGNGEYDAGTDVADTVTVSNHAWAVTGLSTAGLEGAYNLYAFVTADSVTTALSGARAVTLDRTAPAITLSGIGISADTGTLGTDFTTHTAAQTVSATLSTKLAAGDVVRGSLDNGATWTDITSSVSGTTLTWANATLVPGGGLQLQVNDLAGNGGAVATQAYTLDTTAPSLASASVIGDQLTLTYTDAAPLDAISPPAPGAFSVLANDIAVAVNTVTVDAAARTVSLTLASAVQPGDTVTVAYFDPTSDGDEAAAVQDIAGNDARSLDATPVSYVTVSAPPPAGVSAVAPAGGGTLTGTAMADRLLGQDGNDRFIVSGGADTAEGGAGHDTVVAPASRDSYVLKRIDGQLTLTSKANAADITTLRDVERIEFSDMSVNLTVAGAARTVSTAQLDSLVELYIAYVGRVPDADGLEFWIAQTRAGQSLAQIGEAFYAAAMQHASLTGYSATMTSSDFVATVYRNALGRNDPDGEGLAYWTQALDSGQATRGTVVATMLGSAHTFKGHATWGHITNLLDNKISVGKLFSVDMGLVYNAPQDSVNTGMAIAATVTADSTEAAIRLIGAQDGFSQFLG